jgi:hypothetical protein
MKTPETKRPSLAQKIMQDLSTRTEQWLLPFSMLLGELFKTDFLISIGRIFLAPSLIITGLVVLSLSPLISMAHYYSNKAKASPLSDEETHNDMQHSKDSDLKTIDCVHKLNDPLSSEPSLESNRINTAPEDSAREKSTPKGPSKKKR